MRLIKVLASAAVLSLLINNPAFADILAQTTEVVSLSGSIPDRESLRSWLSGASFAFFDNGVFIYDLPGARRDWYPLRGEWEYSGGFLGVGRQITFRAQTTTTHGASVSGVVVNGTLNGNQINMQTNAGVDLSQCSLGSCNTLRGSSNYSSTLTVNRSSR